MKNELFEEQARKNGQNIHFGYFYLFLPKISESLQNFWTSPISLEFFSSTFIYAARLISY